MFTQFKNIDTAFKHIRLFSFLLIGACVVISCFAVLMSYRSTADYRRHIYILANGKALEAMAADRKDNIPVELRDHIATFHRAFFTLSPDEKKIRDNIGRALYLADGSAQREYDNLREKGFYANLVAGSISEEIAVDSIKLDMNRYPYGFTCYATERLVRSTSVTKRPLVTRGQVRNVERSDNNPHGFLIGDWEILRNEGDTTQTVTP